MLATAQLSLPIADPDALRTICSVLGRWLPKRPCAALACPTNWSSRAEIAASAGGSGAGGGGSAPAGGAVPVIRSASLRASDG